MGGEFTWVVSPCPCVVLSSLVCQVSVGSSGARSYGPVTGQSALVVCRYPFKAGVLSLRFFRRDYVASLGDLPQRGSTPYGMNQHPRVLPQLRHHAVTQGGTAFGEGQRTLDVIRSSFGLPEASSSRTRRGSTPRRGHPGLSWTPGPGGCRQSRPPQAPFPARSSPPGKKVEI